MRWYVHLLDCSWTGDWILGYNHYLEECSVFELELELWGILDGLTILNEQRYERVLIHTNSLKSLKIGLFPRRIIELPMGSLN
ncbi:hypothetical protein Goshw_001380 [Gossypium schwendimanii]|uniref:RNase H type-1 domain-containing protein n=1 Tax=Gossypium schwendimanii TaxID=34291 RepID=A0A7J9LJN8_GOSSC|nr:hypothetical protein [Gossypium schwendimanii]